MAKKQNQKLGTGGIIALVIAGLLLIAVLAGVIFYVHSGKAGVGQSAGVIASEETTDAALSSTKASSDEEVTLAEEETTLTEEEAAAAEETTAAESAIEKKETVTKEDGTAAVTFKKSVTAKQMGKFFDISPEDTFKAYDSKTVTLSGVLKDKSAKMLYVELKTGTKVPCRVYLNSEEQREQFNKFEKGDKIKVKGEMAILLPSSTDPGGFQEMASGMIAISNVTLVK